MEKSKLLNIIKNPYAIRSIDHPTDEMKLTALQSIGLLLEYIDHPTLEMMTIQLNELVLRGYGKQPRR